MTLGFSFSCFVFSTTGLPLPLCFSVRLFFMRDIDIGRLTFLRSKIRARGLGESGRSIEQENLHFGERSFMMVAR